MYPFTKQYLDHISNIVYKLEIIQRRATKIFPELRESLAKDQETILQCCLTTLETRRLRRDQI